MECKKTKFLNKKQAQFYIDKLNKKSNRDTKPIRAYWCRYCHSWHLTSKEFKINDTE